MIAVLLPCVVFIPDIVKKKLGGEQFDKWAAMKEKLLELFVKLNPTHRNESLYLYEEREKEWGKIRWMQKSVCNAINLWEGKKLIHVKVAISREKINCFRHD